MNKAFQKSTVAKTGSRKKRSAGSAADQIPGPRSAPASAKLQPDRRENPRRVRDRLATLEKTVAILRLRENEARTLVENSHDFIVRLDRQARQVYVNSATARLYGMQREEVVGKSLRELGFPEDIWRPAEQTCQQVFTTKREAVLEQAYPFGGPMRCFEARHVPEFASNGSVASVLVITREITQHKQAENVLRESEARFRTILENTVDAIGVSRVGIHVFVNPAYLALFGYREPEELVGRPILDLIAPDQRAEIVQKIRQRANGEPISPTYETRGLRKDGTEFDLEVHVSGYEFRGETLTLVILWDMTKHKRAGEALRESQTKYSRLLETMTDAFVTVDLSGRIQEFNRAYCILVGYSEDELHRLTYVDVTPARWHEGEGQIVRDQVLPRGYSDVYEKEYRRKDGTIFPVELRTFLIRDDQNQPAGMWAIIRDITERKRAEEAVRRLSRQLWQAQEDERRRIARELHDSTVQRLAAVLMNLTLLQECPKSSKFPRLLKDARTQVDECVQEIRSFSYLLHPPDLEQLGLKPALRSYLAGFSKRSGIRVALEAPEDPVRFSDEIELTLFRVVQEGLGNILRHAKVKVARVRLSCDDAQIILEVSDPGCGIPVKTLRALREGGSLSGVGVAGMKERLSQVNGQLEIQSSRRGTTLRAVIPIAAPSPGSYSSQPLSQGGPAR